MICVSWYLFLTFLTIQTVFPPPPLPPPFSAIQWVMRSKWIRDATCFRGPASQRSWYESNMAAAKPKIDITWFVEMIAWWFQRLDVCLRGRTSHWSWYESRIFQLDVDSSVATTKPEIHIQISAWRQVMNENLHATKFAGSNDIYGNSDYNYPINRT